MDKQKKMDGWQESWSNMTLILNIMSHSSQMAHTVTEMTGCRVLLLMTVPGTGVGKPQTCSQYAAHKLINK